MLLFYFPAMPPKTSQDYIKQNQNTNNMRIDPQQVYQVGMDAINVGKGIHREYQKYAPQVNSAVKYFNPVRSGVRTGMGRGGNNEYNISKHHHSSGYALSPAPKPADIKLDTGITPNTYVSDYMEAIYLSCSPLHMTCASIQLPTSVTNALYSYFISIEAFELQTRAQTNVGFNLNISTDFSAANILSAMNALLYALQIYFYYKSILSYHSNPANKNKGMIYLRSNITAQILNDLSLLERRLLDTPVPPNFLEFMRYMSGNFYSGDQPNTPLLKICPLTPSLTLIDSTACATALTNMSTPTNNMVYSLMRRSVPHWKPVTLYDVPTEPLYDDNFKTIWANLPYTSNVTGAEAGYPQVASDSDTIQYNIFSNTLDAAAFSMLSFYDTTAHAWIPGLVLPSSLTSPTRMSYYSTSGGVLEFIDSDTDKYLRRSRPETFQSEDTGSDFLGLHLPGAALGKNVNESSVLQSTYKVLDYLMSLSMAKVDAKAFNSGSKFNTSKNKSRNSKPRPKSKSKSRNSKAKADFTADELIN